MRPSSNKRQRKQLATENGPQQVKAETIEREVPQSEKANVKRESPAGENLIVATGRGVVERVSEDSSEGLFRFQVDPDSAHDLNGKVTRDSRRKAATTATATVQDMSEASAADQAESSLFRKDGEFSLKKVDLYQQNNQSSQVENGSWPVLAENMNISVPSQPSGGATS